MLKETQFVRLIFFNLPYGLPHGTDRSRLIDHNEKDGIKGMKTVEEIIAYLQMELEEAHEAHDQAQDKQERLFHLIKASTIEYLLEEIKEG